MLPASWSDDICDRHQDDVDASFIVLGLSAAFIKVQLDQWKSACGNSVMAYVGQGSVSRLRLCG